MHQSGGPFARNLQSSIECIHGICHPVIGNQEFNELIGHIACFLPKPGTCRDQPLVEDRLAQSHACQKIAGIQLQTTTQAIDFIDPGEPLEFEHVDNAAVLINCQRFAIGNYQRFAASANLLQRLPQIVARSLFSSPPP